MRYDWDLKIGIGIMVVLFAGMIYASFNEENRLTSFDQRCKEAGGVPMQREYTCLRPTAIMKME